MGVGIGNFLDRMNKIYRMAEQKGPAPAPPFFILLIPFILSKFLVS